MKALVKTCRGVGNIELKDMKVPEVGPNDVLIKVKYSAVCATDVHLFHDRFANSPPFTLGHEFSGIVERVGKEVSTFSPGARVVSENNPFACGTCRICRMGLPNLCPHKKAMGIHSDGSFAEYVRLPAHLLHNIPAGVALEDAALSEPLAVAVHALTARCFIEEGDTVVVFGVGAIGLLLGQVALAEGAGRVYIVGTSKDEEVRFACARGLGLKPLNVEKDDVVNVIMAATGEYGADVVAEASGSPQAITMGGAVLRRGGRMTVSGITGREAVRIPWDTFVSKGLSIFFSYSSLRKDWEKGLRYLAEGKVVTAPLITHRFPLSAWKDAFDVLERYEAVRPLLIIGEAMN